MKAVFTFGLLLLSLFSTSLHAQTIQEAKVRFAKMERPGLLAAFPFSEGIVENALRARLDRAGFNKPKTDKGFISYQAVSWPEIAPGQLDVYARVDKNSAQSSTVVLLVSKGYDNYISAASDPVISAKLQAFLTSLLPEIQAAQLRAEMAAQEDAIRAAERAYKDADDDGNRLAREKERIEKQLAENEAEKSRRASALSAEKAKLDQLRAMLK
jgi:hypothetical protein